MRTIKEGVIEALRMKGRSTEESVIREYAKRALNRVCALFPSDPDNLKTPEATVVNDEFVSFVFSLSEKKTREEQIDILTNKAMDERDDLSQYPAIRQRVVHELGTIM